MGKCGFCRMLENMPGCFKSRVWVAIGTEKVNTTQRIDFSAEKKNRENQRMNFLFFESVSAI